MCSVNYTCDFVEIYIERLTTPGAVLKFSKFILIHIFLTSLVQLLSLFIYRKLKKKLIS